MTNGIYIREVILSTCGKLLRKNAAASLKRDATCEDLQNMSDRMANIR
jgi:hypothetical protein